MIKEGMTVREAAQAWVHEFNAIDRGMIQKLLEYDPDDWHEVTVPGIGNRVYVYNLPEEKPDGEPYESEESYGRIEERLEDETYRIEMDDGESILVKADDFEVAYDGFLPMWGTMWSFGDSCDNWWLEEDGGIEAMSDCGFRIYESDQFGYFFGIDGAGYDFYEEHWVSAYRKRGLKWHDPATEQGEGKEVAEA